MSYATAMFAVDLDQIRQTIGAGDRKLIKTLKKKTMIDDGDFEGIPISQAIEELINGRFTDPDSAFIYGYALEGLCRHHGTRLDNDQIGDVFDLELDSPLEDVRHPVALPEIDDFPMISSLSKDTVVAEVERLESMDLAYSDDEEIEEARRELLECLKEAAAKGLGVVTFYY
jgi:hypothetical protein